MPKYWGKQIFTHGRFPKVGQKQKTEKKKEEEERKKERLNDGNNNGQAMHGARKHAGRTQAAWAKKNYTRQKKLTNKGDMGIGDNGAKHTTGSHFVSTTKKIKTNDLREAIKKVDFRHIRHKSDTF